MTDLVTINVLTDDLDYVKKLAETLKNKIYFEGLEIRDKTIAKAFGVNKHSDRKMLRFLTTFVNKMKIDERKSCLKISEKFITIFSTELTFETLPEIKQELINCKYPILYVSNFDQDVLEVTVFEDNKEVLYSCYGFGVEVYGRENKEIDKALFRTAFKEIVSAEDIDYIFEHAEVGVIITRMAERFKIPLDQDINYLIRYNWLSRIEPYIEF